MINSDFKVYCDDSLAVPFGLKRREIHNIFISDIYNNKCSFQPGIYQLFESGSILITGGVSFEQVDEVYKYICTFLIKHKDTIKKIQPTNLVAQDITT